MAKNQNCIILGAGLAGLSAAYHLRGVDYEIFEKEEKIGGLCRSKSIDGFTPLEIFPLQPGRAKFLTGFTFDRCGHLLHFKNSYTLSLLKNLMDGGLIEHQRNAWIRSFGVYTRYPFQANSFGLPPRVNKECILGLIKAEYRNSVRNGISKGENIGNGSSFESWILRTFGAGIARHFMLPYNTKFWTILPRELTCEWIDGYIPVPTLEEAIEGALAENKRKFGYNALFWYPIRGGIEEVPLALSRNIKNINTSCEAIEIDIKNKEVKFKDGRRENFDKLISTIPLPELPNLIVRLPQDITSAFKKLRYTSIFNLNLGIDRRNLSNKHWIYFPEEEFIFYRVGFPCNFSSHLVPPGKSSLYVEASYSQDKPINKETIIQRIIENLTKAEILSEEDKILVQDINDIKYGYIIYDSNYHQSVQTISDFLTENEIFSIGRYGRWKYMSMEDVLLDGKKIAQVLGRYKRVQKCLNKE